MFKDSIAVQKSAPDSIALSPKDSSDGSLGQPIGLRFVSRPDGSPNIALSIVLQQQPTAQDRIRPLVRSGQLTFQLMLDLKDYRSGFFARQVFYSVYWKDGSSSFKLASSESQGAEARVAFSLTLNQNQSLDALTLMDYGTSSFFVKATINYRQVGEKRPIRIIGLWQDIAAYIGEHCDQNNTITKAGLSTLMPAMQNLNLLAAVDEENQPVIIPSALLTRVFLRQAGVILRQLVNDTLKDPVYELRNVNYLAGEFDYSETIAVSSIQSKDLEFNLGDLLAQSNVQLVPEQSIFLVAQQDQDPVRTVAVKLNVPTQTQRRGFEANAKIDELAVINGSLRTMSLAIQPVTSSIDYARPEAGVLNKVQLLNLLSVDLFSKKRAKSLPVVNDVNALYFEDRIYDKKAWYLPKFIIQMPALNEAPDNAPFQFTYESKGATNAGKPALTGRLRFVLQMITAEDTTAAILASGRTEILRVPLEQLSFSILLPFIDEADGQTKQYAFPANTTSDGDKITAEVEFSNDWLRLAYGALSTPGFQTSSMQVQIRYLFSCYNPVQGSIFDVIFGAKSLKTQVLYPKAKKSTEKIILENTDTTGYFDAEKLIYNHPRSNVALRLEARAQNNAGRALREDEHFMHTAVGLKPLQAVSPATIKPLVYLQADLLSSLKRIKYNLNTQSVQLALPLVFPCSTYGNFYQQLIDAELHSIGCQDAFKLGEIVYKEYEEISSLSDEQYVVYRSLAQPGRFVLLPERYCITRREVGEPDAYRPLIFLNALLDPEIPTNNKVEFRVTLQPDVPLFKIHQLEEKLKAYHPSPMIEYPTAVQHTGFNINWAIDPAIAATAENALIDASGPFISAYFKSDLPGWQLLKSVLASPGISGSIAVNLADGSQFLSNLLLKLDVVRGTWKNGPLHVSTEAGQTTLTNKTEGKINVIDLIRVTAGTDAESIPVEKTLEPDASCTIPATEGFLPTYTYAMGDPVAIEETRSFVEDIYGNFIIVNLLNFANHDLLQIEIEAKVQGVETLHKGTLTEVERVIEFDYILPLTSFLENFKLDFRITKIFNDRPAELTDWKVWDLNNGPLSITPDLLTN
jgi:hypothetical protein